MGATACGISKVFSSRFVDCSIFQRGNYSAGLVCNALKVQFRAWLRGSLDDVQARLDRIEQERTARQPLKAISS